MDSDAALDLSSLAGCEPALALATIDQCRASLQRGGPLAFDVSVLLGALRAQLVPDADEHQVAFEIHALILALHYEARFLKNPGSLARANRGFDDILARYGVPGAIDFSA